MLTNDGLDCEMPIHDMETIMMLVWSRLLNRLDSSYFMLLNRLDGSFISGFAVSRGLYYYLSQF